MILIIIIIIIIIIFLLFYVSNNEYFSVVNQHRLYTDLRNYIDGNKIIDTQTNTRGLYKISDTCFVDKYSRCIGNKHICQMYSLNSCIGPTMY